jgi:hypothetical protein
MTDKTSSQNASPEIVLRDGPLRAAAWRSDGEYGPQYSTKLSRYYKGDDGGIRETSSMRERDLLPAAELSSEMHREIRDRKREHKQDRSQDGAGMRENTKRDQFNNERANGAQRRKPRDRSAR